MTPQFTTQITRVITLYGDEGFYRGFGEELFSDDDRYFVRFDLSISVTITSDIGDYFSPAEYEFTDENVEITNLHLFDGDSEIEVDWDLEEELLNCITWEI